MPSTERGSDPGTMQQRESSQRSGLTRRDLLRGGVAAGVVGGIGLGSVYFGYGSSVRNPVRVGVIGTGDEGGVLMGAINPNYVQVAAIADIRPYNIHRAFHGDSSSTSALTARPGLISKYGYDDEADARRNVAVYSDRYEELLDDPNIEGVIIALPLHLHAEASVKAMRQGKHVLCEKLMAHSVGECKEMARTAEQTDRLLAVGHQRHYSILYDNAREMIRRGMIGDLHHIRAQWHRGNLPGRDSW
ncbi:MAG: Gfo/Idh/MocA family oxidoreductase, partial [Pirellulales bacterium]|nr:Gfo/Idh/MocA family oxidoreductase [Pirellulales bacterium]